MHSFTWWRLVFLFLFFTTNLFSSKSLHVVNAAPHDDTAPLRNYELRIRNFIISMDAAMNASTAFNATHFSLALDLRRPLRAPLMVHFVINIRIRDALTFRLTSPDSRTDRKAAGQQTVINQTLDYCAFLRRPKGEPFLQLLFGPDPVGQGQADFFNRCPIEIVR